MHICNLKNVLTTVINVNISNTVRCQVLSIREISRNMYFIVVFSVDIVLVVFFSCFTSPSHRSRFVRDWRQKNMVTLL